MKYKCEIIALFIVLKSISLMIIFVKLAIKTLVFGSYLSFFENYFNTLVVQIQGKNKLISNVRQID